jgi:dTDP-4-amino-4,6-dideoxy-D-galactose acyltransferase
VEAPNRIDASVSLSRLLWDSDYFGFPVARIAPAELDDAALSAALRSAREQSVRLVYWATTPGRSVAAETLAEFGGMRVDQKATFARELQPEGETGTASFEVVEYPKAPACLRLLALSVSAGQHSRFKTDPRITAEQHRGLYEMWMRRSTLRELASEVFVAVPREMSSEPIGVITISEAERVGSIGLIAVHESVRGQGVGTRLMRAAHEWMRTTGARRAEVVTQLANRGACRLYQSCGYQLQDVVDYYHFWPLPS